MLWNHLFTSSWVSIDPLSKKPSYSIILASYKGSVSAEHGIGVMKTHALKYSKDATSIALMRKIKELFDPNGIMNPYKVLP